MKHTIVAHNSIRDLTGKGMEALVGNCGYIIAVFSEGNFTNASNSLSRVRVGLSMVDGPTLILVEAELLYA